MKITDEMVMRFLGWSLPRDFSPDCGISFDGRKDDEWNKNKTWPIGTNLLTAIQARAMLERVLLGLPEPLTLAQCRKLVDDHLEGGSMSGADYTLIRAVENAHGIG